MNKKVIAFTLAIAMLVSCTSCSKKTDNSKIRKTILDLAEDYSDALIGRDSGDLADLSDTDEDDYNFEINESGYYDEVEVTAIEAYLDSITYEIDEDSLEIDDDEASVDVTFVIPDFEDIGSVGEISDLISFNAALDDSDTKELILTIKFTEDDDTWFISNSSKCFGKYYGEAYDFLDMDFTIGVDLASRVDYASSYWCLTDSYDEDVYTNTEMINYYISFGSDTSYFDVNIYCVFFRDGDAVYTSEVDHNTDFYLYADQLEDSENNCLPAGLYQINIYDDMDNLIWVATCDVYYEVPSPEGTYIATSDMAPSFLEGMGQGAGHSIEGTVGTVDMDWMFTFNDDGTFDMDTDRDAILDNTRAFLVSNIEVILLSVYNCSVEDLQTMATNSGAASYEEYLDNTANTVFDQVFGDIDTSSIDIHIEGLWSYDAATSQIMLTSDEFTSTAQYDSTTDSFVFVSGSISLLFEHN